MRTLRPSRALLIAAAVLALSGCRSGPSEGWSSRARRMVLTSGPSEVVLSSSRVPGYWARQAETGDEFFLFTRDRSYGKGGRVTVEGPFGPASPTVFREETGEYAKWSQALILVVWKIGTDSLPAGPLPELRSRSGPKGQVMTVVSEAAFVRTAGGDYVDGYFADCEADFQRTRLFLAMELTPFAKGDRLDVSGETTGDSVVVPAAGLPVKVAVFEVRRAAPNVPAAPAIPAVK